DDSEPIRETVAPPTPAEDGGVTRQQVRVPLLPDYPPGDYRLHLEGDGVTHDLGPVTVLRPTVAAEQADADDIETRLDATFSPLRVEPLLDLLGYTLPSDTVRAGRSLDVTLYWQARAPITERYKVSVYLLGGEINPATGSPLYAQVDAEPRNWTLPTTLWPVGTPIADPYALPVPEDVPPGAYTLGVVMYAPTSGERLRVAAGDALELATITVR
ncbi:MAG: hypothetical protein AAF125_15920, partial [Chloroflexota bacterium]